MLCKWLYLQLLIKERLIDRNLCWIPISLLEKYPRARVQDKVQYHLEAEKKYC